MHFKFILKKMNSNNYLTDDVFLTYSDIDGISSVQSTSQSIKSYSSKISSISNNTNIWISPNKRTWEDIASQSTTSGVSSPFAHANNYNDKLSSNSFNSIQSTVFFNNKNTNNIYLLNSVNINGESNNYLSNNVTSDTMSIFNVVNEHVNDIGNSNENVNGEFNFLSNYLNTGMNLASPNKDVPTSLQGTNFQPIFDINKHINEELQIVAKSSKTQDTISQEKLLFQDFIFKEYQLPGDAVCTHKSKRNNIYHTYLCDQKHFSIDFSNTLKEISEYYHDNKVLFVNQDKVYKVDIFPLPITDFQDNFLQKKHAAYQQNYRNRNDLGILLFGIELMLKNHGIRNFAYLLTLIKEYFPQKYYNMKDKEASPILPEFKKYVDLYYSKENIPPVSLKEDIKERKKAEMEAKMDEETVELATTHEQHADQQQMNEQIEEEGEQQQDQEKEVDEEDIEDFVNGTEVSKVVNQITNLSTQPVSTTQSQISSSDTTEPFKSDSQEKDNAGCESIPNESNMSQEKDDDSSTNPSRDTANDDETETTRRFKKRHRKLKMKVQKRLMGIVKEHLMDLTAKDKTNMTNDNYQMYNSSTDSKSTKLAVLSKVQSILSIVAAHNYNVTVTKSPEAVVSNILEVIQSLIQIDQQWLEQPLVVENKEILPTEDKQRQKKKYWFRLNLDGFTKKTVVFAICCCNSKALGGSLSRKFVIPIATWKGKEKEFVKIAGLIRFYIQTLKMQGITVNGNHHDVDFMLTTDLASLCYIYQFKENVPLLQYSKCLLY